MRIVLLNPPLPPQALTNRDLMGGMGIDDGFGESLGTRFLAYLKNQGTRLPVIALASAAAILRGHDCTVLDLAHRDAASDETLQEVARHNPDWVIAASSFAYLGAELDFLARLRQETGAQRLLVGYSAVHFAGEILRRGLAEAIAAGDPEPACQALATGGLSPGDAGVMMLQGEQVVGEEAFIDDLDTLPHPDWSGFDVGLYGYFPLLKKRPFLTVLSSRGCPFQCNFCPYPIAQGAGFRARKPEAVAAEMLDLKARHGVRSILFRDPTFSLEMERVKALCRSLLSSGSPVEFGIETRLDRMDEEMIDLLAEAGCRSCEFGVDPFDRAVLKASHRKNLAPERTESLINRMESLGIAGAGLMVVGLPYQDTADVAATLEFLGQTRLSYLNVELATPFPGTPLYDQALREGWAAPLTLEDLLRGDPKLGFNGALELAAIKRLQEEALSSFYLRPAKVWREIWNKDLWRNVAFMASAGVRYAGQELRRQTS